MFTFNKPPPSKAMPDCESVTRYFDRQQGLYTAKIKPGEWYVTPYKELIVTVLGSCVAACIRDPVAKIGGMNHFMLPNKGTPESDSPFNVSARFGVQAMELLINNLLKHGAQRDRLETKLFGGSQVSQVLSNIGQMNIDFIREYVKNESLTVLAEDMGGTFPRKVVYDPLTGVVRVKKLKTLQNDTIKQREETYQHDIDIATKQAGDIELFE